MPKQNTVGSVRRLFAAENKRRQELGDERITVIQREGRIIVREKVGSRHCRMKLEWLVSSAKQLGLTGTGGIYDGKVGLYAQTWAEFEVE